MHTLMDVASGTYLVETQGSLYVLDLNHGFVLRRPVTADAARLRDDDDTIDLLEIRECTVGRPMILRIDLHRPMVAHTVRGTSPVVRIIELETFSA